MVTLAASAYFLTCCRPVFTSTFCFYIEPPKLINLYHYPLDSLFRSQILGCNYHDKLNDHCLNEYNTCTDCRAWSLDNGQRRRHFLDVISGRIPLCGFNKLVQTKKPGERDGEIKEALGIGFELKAKSPKKEDENLKIETVRKYLSDIDLEPFDKSLAIKEESNEPFTCLTPPPSASSQNSASSLVEKLCTQDEKDEKREDEKESSADEKLCSEDGKQSSEDGKQCNIDRKQSNEDIVLLTDEIIDKLDKNLVNLETTFDKFVKKNRDFIQNLVGCLNFEKQKQKVLENEYNKLKHENDILKTKNEYLKMVNTKQLELFRNELDRGLSENKAVYKKKIQQMEVQIQTGQDELQYYKKNERRYMEVVENESSEIKKLKNDIKSLKSKEVVLLKNYVNVLNFMEDMKETLNNSYGQKDAPLQRSSNTMTDSGIIPNPILRDVLKNALKNGMENLNVRDLSILHDAIEELNDQLCHQNEFCGKSPMTTTNITHSFYSEEFEEYPETDYLPKDVQDYETSSDLSITPSRQKPDNPRVRFV